VREEYDGSSSEYAGGSWERADGFEEEGGVYEGGSRRPCGKGVGVIET